MAAIHKNADWRGVGFGASAIACRWASCELRSPPSLVIVSFAALAYRVTPRVRYWVHGDDDCHLNNLGTWLFGRSGGGRTGGRVGGHRRIRPTNKEDRASPAAGGPAPTDKKLTPVVALAERGARLRLFPVDRVDVRMLQDAIRTIRRAGHSHARYSEHALPVFLPVR